MGNQLYIFRGGDGLCVEDDGVIEIESGGRIHLESGAVLNLAAGAMLRADGINLPASIAFSAAAGGTNV